MPEPPFDFEAFKSQIVPKEDPFNLKGKAERKKRFALTVSVDEGSTEYLFAASEKKIAKSFRSVFPECNVERDYALHMSLAGTSIDIYINLLVLGGGIVAAELIKEITKDLWRALKGCFVRKSLFSRRRMGGFDNLTLTIPYGKCNVSVRISSLGYGSENNIKEFIDSALPKLVELLDELKDNDGLSASLKFRVPPETERIELTYDRSGLSLSKPRCLGCKFLEADYVTSPCKFCLFYQDKPGKHAGRPGMTITKEGVSTTCDELENPIPERDLIDYRERQDNFVPRA